MPINLKRDLLVAVALMHIYGIITVLPSSKYASPIFSQMKPNGKLRLLVDLKEINKQIADDYTKNNHPVSTLSDRSQPLAVKSSFCKLDCSWLITFCKWLTNDQWKCLHSILLAELCLKMTYGGSQQMCVCFFQVSCASICTK